MPYIGNIVQDFSVNTAMLNTDSVTSIKIDDGTIVNADINDSAAIAGTKIDPSFKSTGDNIDEISLTHSGNTVKIASLGQISSHGSLALRKNNGSLTVRLSATTESSYINSGGNVGIGTSSPSTPLHVSTNTDGTSDLLTLHADADGTNNGIASIKFTGNTGNHAAFIKGGHTTNGDSILTFHTDAHDSGINPEERMRIDTSGNVGIGTTSIDSALHVYKQTNDRTARFQRISSQHIDITQTSGINSFTSTGKNFEIGTTDSQSFIFDTNGSERMRIDSDGRLLIGSTSALSHGGIESHLQVLGTGTDDSSITLSRFSNNVHSPYIAFAKSRNGSVGGNTVVQSGDSIGRMTFFGNDGTDGNTPAAEIDVEVDGTPGSNDMPGRIVFRTTSDGASSVTERMRVDSSGDITVNFDGSSQTGQFKIADGSASSPGLTFWADGSNDTGIFRSGANTLNFSTTGTERMRIDSSGGVSIGLDDAKSNHLLVRGSSTVQTVNGHIMLSGDSATAGQGPQIVFSESGISGTFAGAYIGHIREGSNSIGPLVFGTRGSSGDANSVPSERMRIHADGKVAIGSTTASSPLHIFGIDTTIGVHTYPQLTLQTASTDGAADKGSGIMFLNHDGTSGKFGGGIRVLNENATSGNHASYMAFSTRPAGGSVDEYVRIDSTGRVLLDTSISDSPAPSARSQMGTNATSGPLSCFFDYGGYNTSLMYMQHARAGANNNAFSGIMIQFRNKDNSQVGKIHADVGATMYATSSDYRLKENVVAISDGITRLKTLKPYRFNWKVDKNRTIDGFLAHEVTAVPEAISGTKDGVDENGDPDYQTIDQSKIVPLLTAALQEAISKIETLETKVAALEAA